MTPTMKQCLEFVKANGGSIERYPGGFWAQKGWRGWRSGKWFGTTTVQSLVKRGLLQYSKMQHRACGRDPFPVEATIVSEAEKGQL